jgi:ComEC/Rec2-related protein
VALEARLAGEVVRVRGRVQPVARQEPWLVARHIGGRLTVLVVEGWRPGDPSARVANGLRRTLAAGADPMNERQRALFTGLVIGDDRHQPVDLADDFLGAGLTHLLAVSGQNVAFVLALTGPLLRRLRLWPRLLCTLGVISLFGVMTRFEPSVLRASVMAGLAATVAMAGQPTARARIIGLAVTGLLLADPLLVRSAGFQLSVCAATAIVVLAPRLTPVLPGPASVREALGVTLAAQLGVAPVLLLTFGPVPVASLPANLLAVPVAGLVMVWGLTVGMLAGIAPEPWAGILHVPTRLALTWLELVADRAARAPLGELRVGHFAGLAVGLMVAVVARHRPGLSRCGRGVAALALAAAVVAAHAPPPLRSSPAAGVVRWHAGGTDVVVLGGAGGRSQLGAPAVLEGLRRNGLGALDVLVVADPSVPETVVRAVLDAHPTREVLVASMASLDGLRRSGTRVPPDGAVLELGGLTVRLVVVPGRVVVDAVPRGP